MQDKQPFSLQSFILIRRRSPYKYIRTLLIISLLVFWAACKTPAPVQSARLNNAAPLPATYHSTDQSAAAAGENPAGTTATATIPWETFFKDSSLKKLIRQGLDYNYDLSLAINRISIAEECLKQAKNLQLPTLGISATGSTTRFSDNGLTGQSMTGAATHHYEDYTLQGQLSWEADIWGKIKNQQKYELQQLLSTREAAQAVRTRLIADIATGYYNLLILEKQYQVASSSLILADSTLQLTELLKFAGKANQLSVQQTSAQRQTVALLLPDLEDQISNQQNALLALTGAMPGTIGDHSDLDEVSLPGNIVAGPPADLLSNRPDVLQAEWQLKMAISKIAVAKANLYPSLRITATGGVESLKASNWFNLPASLFGIVAGSIAQPIFQQGALKKDYHIAQLEKENAVIAFRSTLLQAVGEVSNALTHYQKLRTQAEMALKQVDTLQSGEQNAALLYKSGLANYLEVISAQNNTLQASLNLAAIHGHQLMAAVEIYRSLGGGRQLQEK
ncbi:efflux transporter, outer membrane factor (OMF) lipoprotein, NodT family [Arachidicoccus rhizosphaerae]|uniref:Efflux transporter, outer membrane factor (OMF) lipoprotein, NodT family n=1 Tax=Arachidicoccus rhizosphaerae TaxID=551991 RepID=A0A1H3XBK9_9BACT|nr:efflux transporter outer membrane subunit [Arachidicoccus rhizosphaerae]SDZ96002.1 efflux transporter, outer membrane factor (OMF) lipoprotein, NodT family [Arachidicoccus rhizosphaerae]